MKNLITLAGMIIMLAHSACRTNKLVNRQRNLNSESTQAEVWSRKQEHTNVSQTSVLTDSNTRFYEVSIFPTDSFRLSLDQGFSGKASKIELRGSEQQIRRLIGSRTTSTESDSLNMQSLTREANNSQTSVLRAVEKKKVNVLVLAVLILLTAVFAGWVYKRNRGIG